MSTFTFGKSLLSLVSLITMAGPYLADWNETHIHNPNWPPHARYHNGQTMTTGLLTGLISLYLLYWIIPRSPIPAQLTHLNWLLVLLGLYYVSSLSGIWYPGAGWTDPEFGEDRPQLFGFPVVLVVTACGWWLETGRVRGLRKKGEQSRFE